MTGSQAEKLAILMERGQEAHHDANVVDLAVAQTIMDSGRHNNGRLVRLDKKVFGSGGPVDPVALEDSIIIRTAYRIPE